MAPRGVAAAVAAAALLGGVSAQSPTPTTLASWNLDATTLAAQYVPSGGVFAASSTMATVGGVTPSYSSTGVTGGAISLTNFPASGANATAGFQFCVPSTGYTPTTVTVAIRRSNTGPRDAALGYRAAVGGAWTDAWAVNTLTPASFDTYTVNVATSDPAVSDNAALCWRVVATTLSTGAYAPASGTTYGPTTGTFRFDNVAVLGVPVVSAVSASASPSPAAPSPPATGTPSASGVPSPTSSPGAEPSTTPSATASTSVSASAVPPSPSSSPTATPTTTVSSTRSPSVAASPTPPVLAGWLFDGSNTVATVGSAVVGATLTTAAVTASYLANAPFGNALSMTNFPAASAGNATAGFTFCASSDGYAPVGVTMSLRRSATGPKHVLLQARPAPTVAWRDVAVLAATVDSVFETYNVPVTDAALAYAPALCFRAVTIFAPGGTAYVGATSSYGTTGTLRVDNLYVYAQPTDAPSATPSTSGTASVSGSPSSTASPSGTATPTGTPSATPSGGASASGTPSSSATSTASPSATPTGTPSASATPGAAVAIVGFSFDATFWAPTNGSLAGAPASVVQLNATGGVSPSLISNAPLGNALTVTNFPAASAANATAGVSVCLNTLGWAPTSFAVGLRRSNTGPKHAALQARPAVGGAWVDVAPLTASGGSVWDYSTVVLPEGLGLANSAWACLRVVAVWGPSGAYEPAASTSSYGSGGTLRFENLFIFGQPTALPSPTPTPSGTAASTPTASASLPPSGSPTASLTPSSSVTPSASASAGASATATPSGSPAPSASGSTTASPSTTATTSSSATPTASGTGSALASPTTLAAWDFDASTTAASAGVSASTASATALGGTTVSYLSNSPLGMALSLTNFPADGAGNATAGLQLCASTDGFAPVALSLSLRMSNSGAKHKALQVRTYVGGPWADVAALTSTVASAFETFTVPLTGALAADSMLANNPALCFRVVAIFGPSASTYTSSATGTAYTAGGTMRFDQVSLTGRPTAPSTPTPTPSNTRTSSGTPSGTPSSSATGSVPPTPSGTGSSSGTPSGTPSPSATMPEVPSTSPTATGSPSVTPSSTTTAAPTVVPVFTLAAYAFESSLAPANTSVGAGVGDAVVLGGLSASYLANAPFGSALQLTNFPAATAGNATAGVRFCVSTLGFAPFRLSVELRRSATGAKHAALQASLAGAAGPWADVALLVASSGGVAFDRYAVPLNGTVGAPDVSNAAGLCLRIVAVLGPSGAYEPASTGSTYGTGGTLRVDNLALAAVATALPSATPSTSLTSSPSLSASPTASLTSTASFGASPSTTGTPTGSVSASGTPSAASTPSVTPTRTPTASRTPTATTSGVPSATPTPTATPSVTATATSSRSPTATRTASRTVSPPPTSTPTGSASATASETASVSATTTPTGSVSASGTGTPSPSGSLTGTPSSSETGSPSQTPSASATPSGSATHTAAATPSGSRTVAPTGTATKTRAPVLPSRSATATRTRTATATRTRTRTRSRTPSKKRKMLRA